MLSSFLTLFHCLLHPLSSTEKFLKNGSVEGGRRAAAAGTYEDVDVSDDDDESGDDVDESGDDEDESGSDSEDEHATTTMPTKTKGSVPGKKAAPSPAAESKAESKKNVNPKLHSFQISKF